MRSLIFCLFLCGTVSAKSEINDIDKINPNAPIETQQFEPLLGHWVITDFNLTADGSWQKGQGAEWHWYTILDGHAIQDDWIAPPLNRDTPDSERQFGTNIRIFNPEKHQWELAWMSKKGQQLNTFTANMVNNEIVMHGTFSGNESKITFYDIQANRFHWKLEIKTDTDWKEVYRIIASRKK